MLLGNRQPELRLLYSEEAVLVPRPARGVGHVLFFWPLAGFLERSWFDALFVLCGDGVDLSHPRSMIPVLSGTNYDDFQ